MGLSSRIFAVVAFCALGGSHAQAAQAAETCLSVNQDLSLGAALPKTAAILKLRQPLKIVAIGSSSTVGLYMTDPAKTYVGMMQSELQRLSPGLQLAIVNSGRNGDTIPGNIARFETDVFAHDPDLVVWQIGGNDFTWFKSGHSLEMKISAGIGALRARGADVVLMDQQYTPVILATSYAKMQTAIENVAKRDQVAYFPRFEIMHRTVKSGVKLGAFSAMDGLHMSADGYECVGRALARAIMAAAK